MNHGVNVGSATGVETGVNRRELDDTSGIGEVTATSPGLGVDVAGGTSGVTSVETSGVGGPKLDQSVWDGRAGPAVDQTDVEDELDTTMDLVSYLVPMTRE